jgi:hypothetical protein
VPSFVNYKKGCIRLAAASDKVYSEITEQIKPNLAVIVEKIQVVPFQI